MYTRVALLCVTLCASVAVTHGWGPDGHEITATIGQKQLTSTAWAAIQKILPEGDSLSDVATWADSVKHLPQWEWSSRLHFVNPPADKCDFNMARDCSTDACVVGAIVNFTTQLNSSMPAVTRLETARRALLRGGHRPRYTNKGFEPIGHLDALKFVIHFCGDVHQPLHCSGKLEGGNLEYVYWFGESSELHRVWDSSIILKRISEVGGQQVDLTNEIMKEISNGTYSPYINSWKTCYNKDETYCPGDWAFESAELACNHAFKDVHYKEDLTEPYYKYNLPIVEERLAQGGIRLGHLLNMIFDDSYRQRYHR